jgi:low affinity Fe/Cu permease
LRDIKEKIEELDERVKAYSEEAEDDTVHLKVSNFLPDEQEIREIIDNLEDGTRYLPLHREL